MTIIGHLDTVFLILSFAIPAYLGIQNVKIGISICCGWTLFIVAFLFQDLFSPMLAMKIYGREPAERIMSDQPGTIAAVLIGWWIGIVFHKSGEWARRLSPRLRKRTGLTRGRRPTSHRLRVESGWKVR